MRLVGWIGVILAVVGIGIPANSHSQSPFPPSHAALQHRSISQEGIGVGLTITPEKGWHLYWRYPGDSGATLKTNWGCDGLPPADTGMKLEPTAWPIPDVLPVGPLVNYGYAHAVTLPFMIPCNAALTKRLTVDAEWLVCKEECIPQFATLELLPPWNKEDSSASPLSMIFPSGSVLSLVGSRTGNVASFALPPSHSGAVGSARFIPSSSDQIVNAALQKVNGNEISVTLTSDSVDRLSGLIRFSAAEAHPVSVTIPAAPSSAASNGSPNFATVLLWAFIGGVILNAMPCVFPVLGLKIYQLVSATPAERHTNSILYALGVCLSMLALGGGIGLLRSAGVGVGWGTQLQNPAIVYSLALLFVLLGCNLLGMFELGSALQSAAGKVRASGPLMDGLLTVLVATPCTAPFMAGAVAVAFTLPLASQLLIFLFLGLGVATPVLMVGVVPAFAKILPRPGEWMDLFKQFLAWPLFASAVWLMSVLIAQVGLERANGPLFGIVVLGFLVWLFTAVRPTGFRKWAFILAGIVLVYCFYPAPKPALSAIAVAHVSYDKTELTKLRAAGVPVFLDATATWCITCQSNKKLVLHTDAVMSAFFEKKIVWMEADWTEPNEDITNLLNEFGRAGVPLNVYFPPQKEPIVFPPILTSGMVLEALAR